ncbi:alcohol dehydrogenase catalytic domain-containing protein [Hymenobacter terrenus]|uniref:alcohol dehydrogenase catalytic domain-containing protein n=1 Tax=Hymenobacter terrenus TaxID=1629124 RepID=UPI000697B633|nr:alcohol dehydrogenase catalytic domain-containing protein [Hymenobacter terrenus]
MPTPRIYGRTVAQAGRFVYELHLLRHLSTYQSSFMQAVVLTNYGGIENFALADVPTPEPKADEIRVRLRAASFNPIDSQIRRGGDESKLVSSPILGRDFAGVIDQVGAAVTDWRIGDPVFGYCSSMGSNGTYAEYLCIPANIMSAVPAALTFAEAAALPVAGLTALHTWQVSRVGPTASVLISRWSRWCGHAAASAGAAFWRGPIIGNGGQRGQHSTR